MKKYISKLHYLTQDHPNRSHIEQALSACEAGANWVQYRCLAKTDEELLSDMHQIAAICDDWGATLIITNHLHLLDKADVQGVHIEDMDADFTKIREEIGEDKTLGGSANNFDQVKRGFESGAVDYFGCGPFSMTLTKPNSYPTLGTSGYRDIVERMKAEGIDIPLLAVGGIGIDDIDELLQTGVYGIAVSAAVNLADDPAAAMRELYRKVF